MALSLGTLNVVFSASTRDFDRGFKRVRDSINRLDGESSRALENVSESTEAAGNEARRAGQKFTTFGDNAKALANKLRVLAFVGGTALASIVALRQEMAGLAVAAGGVITAIQLDPVHKELRSTADAASTVADRMDRLNDIADEAGTRATAIGGGYAELVSALADTRLGMEAASQITRGFAINMRSTGEASEDINSKLQDLAEITKTSSTTMADLKEQVAFTDRPLRTLSEALDMSIARVKELDGSGRKLSLGTLTAIAEHLESTAGPTRSLVDEFNRLINTFTELLDATDIADAVSSAISKLDDSLQGGALRQGIRDLSSGVSTFFRDTLPAFASSVSSNWDKIVTVTKTAIGALIGAAVGGAPGALIGALIGGFEKTAAVMGAVTDALGFLTDNFVRSASVITGAFVTNGLLKVISKAGSAKAALGALAGTLGRFALGGVIGLAVSGFLALRDTMGKSRQEADKLIESIDRMTNSFKEQRVSRLQSTFDKLKSKMDEVGATILELEKKQKRLREEQKSAAGGRNLAGQRLEETNEKLEEQRETLRRLSERYPELKQQIQEAKAAMDDAADSGNRAADGLSRRQLGDRARGSFAEPVPPGGTEDRAQQIMDRLREGADSGSNSVDGMSASLIRFIEKLEEANDKSLDFKKLSEDIGDAFADSLTRAVIQGEELSSVLENLGKQIASMIFKRTVGRGISNMVANAIMGMTGNTTTMGVPSGGGTGGGSTITTGNNFAKGGIANEPSTFGEAGPEAAVPLPDGRSIPVSMQGGGERVVINDQRSAEAPEIEQSTSTGPDGRRQLELTVRDTVSRQITRGEHDKALRDRFGAQPRTRKR